MDILAGNSKICERVRLMLTCERIPHALMLEGDTGTGRHTLARYIAAHCMCEDTSRPCFSCKGCHMTQIGSHPDVSVISPDGKQLSVDKIRALRQDAYLSPAIANRKVYIIEKAETMNDSAQNALLKILEEPPQNVIFILITVSAEKLLTTVRSRCITLSLLPPPRDEGIKYITEHTSFSSLEADRALESTKNNLGEALRLLEEDEKNTVCELASLLLSDIKSSNSYTMMQHLKPLEKNRAAIDELFEELLLKISALLRESCYTHIKEGLSREQLISLYEITRELRESSINNPNTLLLFANLCSRYKTAVI